MEGKGAKASPCPLVSTALLLSGQKKTSRPTFLSFLRHLTYMDIKVAASGLTDHPTWSQNLFEFVFSIQLESLGIYVGVSLGNTECINKNGNVSRFYWY